MLPIHVANNASFGSIVSQAWNSDPHLREKTSEIIAQVRSRGDAALLGYTSQFDNFPADSIEQLILGPNQLKKALASLADEQVTLLRKTIKRIEDFHHHQMEQGFVFHDAFGNKLGQKVGPLARVGLYTPGGKAAYPSSLIMNAIPARIAGVASLCVCSPCPSGEINQLIPATAALCGVEQLVLAGGAQAIAALAFGTESIERVDKITGPGNSWVTEAKRQVYGQVGLDMLAGPSEILIIDDGSVEPELVLADLCAQAEHDQEAKATLLTTCEQQANAVQRLAKQQQPSWSRRDIITHALTHHGAIVLCQSLQQAVEITNQIAPEHLELLVENPEPLLDSIHNAGAIFIGRYTCESFGDYCAGPNHVLPTAGNARFASPLGVYDFMKRTSLIECSQQGAKALAELAAPLAELEGLPAHRDAALLRS